MPFTGSKATDQAVAGFTAGFVSTVSLHPLDLVKTRLQVNETSFRALFPLLGTIRRQEGMRGFYRGMSPNLLGATASWGIYFFWYSHIKDAMNHSNEKLQAVEHLSASALAGLLTSLVTNPVWVVKTRMFTQPVDDPQRYKNVFDGLRRLFVDEGVRGCYRGIVPAMFGVSHGALQFMAYEQLKIYFQKEKQSTLEYISMAACSKVFATVCTYPYQVVKSRMQTEQKILAGEYSSVSSTIKSIYRNERMGGFYKGMGVNLIRVLPGTCITFAVYEAMSSFFASY
jgi:solute carrier family 25 folate transporter 32